MNTDTPETESTMPERDNLWAKHDGLTPRCCADMIALAGKLEIERNQARKERDELKEALEIAWNHLKGERIRHDYVTCDNQTLQEIMTNALEKLKEPKSEGVS